MSAIEEYRSALQRLIQNRPTRLPRGTRISKDSVSMEAGRKRGTIKCSRPQFKDLVDEIHRAAVDQQQRSDLPTKRLEKCKADRAKYRKLYKETLGRELMLIDRLAELEKKFETLRPSHRRDRQ